MKQAVLEKARERRAADEGHNAVLSAIDARLEVFPPHGVKSQLVSRKVNFPHEKSTHQKPTCLTPLSLGPYVVQICPRNPRTSEGTKPANLIA